MSADSSQRVHAVIAGRYVEGSLVDDGRLEHTEEGWLRVADGVEIPRLGQSA